MQKTTAVLVILLFVGQGLAGAATISSFSDGKTEAVVSLAGPMYTEYINLSLPAECLVKNATMDVQSVPPDGSGSDCPTAARLFLGDKLLWQFSGTDYGAFGKQEAFISGLESWKTEFPEGGGNSTKYLRLMKNATILNASMNVDCTGPSYNYTLTKKFITKTGELFGYSCANAGDVNRDSYDDFMVSAPINSSNGYRVGTAYLSFGGPNPNPALDLTLLGPGTDNYFGVSVSGAGDVNGDGYDDVLVCSAYLPVMTPVVDNCRAYVYFGGPNMDNVTDLTIEGPPDTSFGFSASGAGDLNNDGYDDIIIGANNSATANGVGKAFIYYGGANIDNSSDVVLESAVPGDGFGIRVSGAGDVNKDGFDDIIVGAWDHRSKNGRACLYFGGAKINITPDVSFSSVFDKDGFGSSVSDAGDLNGDGYDDVAIGAPEYYCSGSGHVYIYYGKANMDALADVTLTGEVALDGFGGVSTAGDVNNDGYDDLLVGAIGYNNDRGKVYLYYGRGNMNNNSDYEFLGEAESDVFGWSVSGAGDVNDDGLDEIIVGTPNEGFYLFTHDKRGLPNPNVTIQKNEIWGQKGIGNGSEYAKSFHAMLSTYLGSSDPTFIDEYWNAFVDVPVTVSASGEGNITISQLNICYRYRSSVPDFAAGLNEYIAAHKTEKDPSGNLTIPIKLVSSSPGRLKLMSLKLVLDEAPRLVPEIPDVPIEEDTARDRLLDLWQHFKDDFDVQQSLNFSLVSTTNGSLVRTVVLENRYLSADAQTGPENDNWTGEVRVVVRCTDTSGNYRDSNEFRVTVTNVNDPPVFTSVPPTTAVAGTEYSYQAVGVDGDNDALTYNLSKKPQNMTINSTSGLISWVPSAGGAFEVKIEVSDGQVKNYQNYIIMVAYRPPRITDTTVPDAQTGVPFSYDIPAVSDDGRDLSYKLLSSIEGMAVDASSGLLSWTPEDAGDYPVSVNISDSKTWIIHNFTIHVVKGNKAPKFASEPVKTVYVGMPYSYEAKATDDDNDALGFSLDTGPAGMTIDASSGKISWTPAAAGNQTVRIKVSDGKGGEAFQEFVVTVRERVKANVQFTAPSEGQKVKGKLAVTGSAVKGTLDIVKVQLRADSGDWTDATGNSSWTYTLDTTKLKNGKHTLQARAFDGMDYSDIANRTVTVDNQKAAGKASTPGFAGIAVAMALAAALVMLGQKRKTGRQNAS